MKTKLNIIKTHFLELSNIQKRFISSIALIFIAIYSFFFSISTFYIILISIIILMSFEWYEMTKNADNTAKWHLIGFIYILIPVWSILEIRLISSNVILWMFSIIWTTDIFAYFAGKTLKGPKLAPKISPNKTWSGLIGGIAASIIIGAMSSIILNGGIIFFIFLSGFLSILEQIGDLIESKIKRIFKIKDSGDIIPGHGGILDRFDGLIIVAPVTLLLINLFPSSF